MKPPLLVVPGLAAGVALIALLLVPAKPYRSPLGSDAPLHSPRQDALAHLLHWRWGKLADEQRLARMMRSLDTPKMVLLGKEIVHGRGICLSCHKAGQEGTGTLGPNLEDVGARAASRVAGLSDVAYLAQSLYEPERYVVPGFQPAMPPVTKPPIALTDLDVLMVIAYLQSLGGTPTVGPHTHLDYQSDGTVTSAPVVARTR